MPPSVVSGLIHPKNLFKQSCSVHFGNQFVLGNKPRYCTSKNRKKSRFRKFSKIFDENFFQKNIFEFVSRLYQKRPKKMVDLEIVFTLKVALITLNYLVF